MNVLNQQSDLTWPIAIAMQLVSDGYAYIEGGYYRDRGHAESLDLFQESYFRLPADNNGGNRYRAYSRYTFKNGFLQSSNVRDYVQSREYNYTDGGKVRRFAEIDESIRNTNLIEDLIMLDLDVVRKSNLVSFDGTIRIGLHQIRYRPTGIAPSFSSPPWLHRDDETIVFIHLANLSANIVGGDNVIATSDRAFETVLRLEAPLDTLCVTRKKLHAVTPVAARNGGTGYRDILLVTFEPEVEGGDTSNHRV
jgi:L-isoleucine 4-hydroxylase